MLRVHVQLAKADSGGTLDDFERVSEVDRTAVEQNMMIRTEAEHVACHVVAIGRSDRRRPRPAPPATA